MATNQMLESALRYLSMGFSVIPITPGDKAPPLVEWTQFQERLPSRTEVISWWSNTPKANIGIITGKISGICVVDHDKYKPDYKIEIALQYFPDGIITPCATTPRGGFHMIFKNPDFTIGGTSNMGGLSSIDLRCDGNYVVAPPSVNGNGTPYKWVDGADIFSTTISLLPNIYIELISKTNALYRGKDGGSRQLSSVSSSVDIWKDGVRDDNLYHVALSLARQKNEKLYTFKVLIAIMASWGECDEKWAWAKVESAYKDAERKDRNLTSEVREWILSSNGVFMSSEVQKCLLLSSREDSKNLSKILGRFCSEPEKLIERSGTKNGCYRVIEQETLREKEFIEGSIAEFNIRLPLGLSEICKLYSKNIVIVAGSKSSGKTAFLLNIAKLNQNHHDILYFDSEMGDEEWSQRMKNLGYNSKKDIKYKTVDLERNFQDRITGEKKIYIIDYLEIYENFYEIGKPIRMIHEKLRDGICFIGVQKKLGEKLGRGGEFSMEKSRLYLSFDYIPEVRATKVFIEDIKSPKVPDAKGMWKNVKITEGSNLSPLTEADKIWRR